jgi:probable rRNA maturation factor
MTPRRRVRSNEVGPRIEVMVRSARWKMRPRSAALIRKAVAAAARAVSTPPAELAIVLTDDSAIRTLNRNWRGHDTPTNVLSFPSLEGGRGTAAARHLGDIVIAYQSTAREAVAERKPFAHHLAHLAVHGFLHLVGFDHDNDREARRMERLEVEILARLAVPDPYAAPRGRS